MRQNRAYILMLTSLSVIALSLLILTLWEKPREWIRAQWINQQRQLLAKAQADITGKGMHIVALKVKTADTLSIEIFDWDPEKSISQFRTRIILPEKRDAHVNFRGNAVNLALADMDNDGILEIVAPSFDENLIPRLHIYKFNDQSQGFDRMNPDDQILPAPAPSPNE